VSAPGGDPRSFAFPPALARVLARLPQWPPSAATAAALNLAMGRLIEIEPLRPLLGKRLELRVIDAGVRVRLTYTGQRFAPVWDARSADVVISASAGDFLLLARRKVDPDSLFFSRRLVMEGDTELGLLVKNTLDAVDFAALWRGRPGGRLP
jgi:O2-independent ubiquinone biosynthesis accessory factor UbiT